MVRKLGTAAVAAMMLASSMTAAFAGTDSKQGTLAPGGAAGVEQAAFLGRNALLILLGLGVVAGGVWLAAGGKSGGNSSTSTTSAP